MSPGEPLPGVSAGPSHRLGLLAVVGLGIVAYARTLHVPWYFDDLSVLVENPALRDLPGALGAVLSHRGLSFLTFALNFTCAGLSLPVFHLTNLAIHLTAALLVLALLRRVFPGHPDAALFGALIFVVHPLQTQAVTYVVQRMASLAGLLVVAAVLLYLRATDELVRGAPVLSRRCLLPFLAGVALGAAAIGAKENAIALPLLLLVVELFLRSGDGAAPPFRRLLAIVPFAIAPILFTVRTLAGAAAGSGLQVAPIEPEAIGGAGTVSSLAYFATELEVHWRYLWRLVLPIRQVFDFGLEIPPDPLRWTALLAGVGLLALLLASFVLRRREPAVPFGCCWWLAALAGESSFVPLDPYFEHRLYLPMVGAAAAAAGLIRLVTWERPRVFRIVAMVVVAALLVLTLRRNEQWRDPMALWKADLEHGSRSYRSALGLADALHRRGANEDAAEVYREFVGRALERCGRAPCGPKYLTNAGVAAERMGDPETALDFHDRAVASAPGYAPARFNRGAVRYGRGDLRGALEDFGAATTLAPGDADASFNFALVALQLGDPAPARARLPDLERVAPRLAGELAAELSRVEGSTAMAR